jgi:hypothetical protein
MNNSFWLIIDPLINLNITGGITRGGHRDVYFPEEKNPGRNEQRIGHKGSCSVRQK